MLLPLSRITRCFFALSIVALAACTPTANSSQDAGQKTRSAVVGATGGSVSNGGSSVTIPAGALPGNVTITNTETPEAPAPSGAAVVGTAYTFGPEGQTFAVPVTVTLAFDPSKLPAGHTAADIVVFTAPVGSTQFTSLGGTLVDATHIAAQTTHFSVFEPGVAMGSTDGGAVDAGPADGGVEPDAGEIDAGTDAGPADAGEIEVDGGAVDSGTPDTDAGAIDAGPADLDAGPEADAGSTDVDAGPTENDAGIPDTDAGSIDVDAGSTDGGMMAFTCANILTCVELGGDATLCSSQGSFEAQLQYSDLLACVGNFCPTGTGTVCEDSSSTDCQACYSAALSDACAGSYNACKGGSVETDGGSDAGTGETDAGIGSDAGEPSTDAGIDFPDAGSTGGNDGGTLGTDGGTSNPDGGVVAFDAGAGSDDAGSTGSPDAGTGSTDAGVSGLSCSDVDRCVQAGNSVDFCFPQGTPEAQHDYSSLAGCLSVACPAEVGGACESPGETCAQCQELALGGRCQQPYLQCLQGSNSSDGGVDGGPGGECANVTFAGPPVPLVPHLESLPAFTGGAVTLGLYALTSDDLYNGEVLDGRVQQTLVVNDGTFAMVLFDGTGPVQQYSGQISSAEGVLNLDITCPSAISFSLPYTSTGTQIITTNPSDPNEVRTFTLVGTSPDAGTSGPDGGTGGFDAGAAGLSCSQIVACSDPEACLLDATPEAKDAYGMLSSCTLSLCPSGPGAVCETNSSPDCQQCLMNAISTGPCAPAYQHCMGGGTTGPDGGTGGPDAGDFDAGAAGLSCSQVLSCPDPEACLGNATPEAKDAFGMLSSCTNSVCAIGPDEVCETSSSPDCQQCRMNAVTAGPCGPAYQQCMGGGTTGPDGGTGGPDAGTGDLDAGAAGLTCLDILNCPQPDLCLPQGSPEAQHEFGALAACIESICTSNPGGVCENASVPECQQCREQAVVGGSCAGEYAHCTGTMTTDGGLSDAGDNDAGPTGGCANVHPTGEFIAPQPQVEAPPVLAGGAVLDGTYSLTAVDEYNDQPASSPVQETLVISGAGFALVVTDATSPGSTQYSGKITYNGTTATLDFACPSAFSFNIGYEATDGQLVIVSPTDANAVLTFTLTAAPPDGGLPDAGPVDGGTGLSCGGILDCQQTAPIDGCFAAGSPEGQQQFSQLYSCLNSACPTAMGAACEILSSTTCQQCETTEATSGACVNPYTVCTTGSSSPDAGSADAGIP
jgi:hypothetical protein